MYLSIKYVQGTFPCCIGYLSWLTSSSQELVLSLTVALHRDLHSGAPHLTDVLEGLQST